MPAELDSALISLIDLQLVKLQSGWLLENSEAEKLLKENIKLLQSSHSKDPKYQKSIKSAEDLLKAIHDLQDLYIFIEDYTASSEIHSDKLQFAIKQIRDYLSELLLENNIAKEIEISEHLNKYIEEIVANINEMEKLYFACTNVRKQEELESLKKRVVEFSNKHRKNNISKCLAGAGMFLSAAAIAVSVVFPPAGLVIGSGVMISYSMGISFNIITLGLSAYKLKQTYDKQGFVYQKELLAKDNIVLLADAEKIIANAYDLIKDKLEQDLIGELFVCYKELKSLTNNIDQYIESSKTIDEGLQSHITLLLNDLDAIRKKLPELELKPEVISIIDETYKQVAKIKETYISCTKDKNSSKEQLVFLNNSLKNNILHMFLSGIAAVIAISAIAVAIVFPPAAFAITAGTFVAFSIGMTVNIAGLGTAMYELWQENKNRSDVKISINKESSMLFAEKNIDSSDRSSNEVEKPTNPPSLSN